ncbi:hypothetical protein PAL_GLEAN10007642 [Pteropus alecto]|uniref:Secreted protein n=1 Tax=Pteropus alecto TaxID=9402 RepID=L5KG74_PTEAL|nr:hypothetical protein PAL_GLEAN10007642 [Pteropus alecto]
MNKSLLLGLLILLCCFKAPPTLCMVCNNLNSGHCLQDQGNCTIEQSPGCRSRDFFIFTEKGNAVESGSSVLSRPLTSDTVQELPSLMETLLGGGCVCSLETRLRVVGEDTST